MLVGVVPGLYFKSYSRYTESRIPFEALALCGAIESVDSVGCELVDFNIRSSNVRRGLSGARFPGLELNSRFYVRAAAALRETGAEVFVFPISIHTNGNLYHSLRIAGCLRELLQDTLMIFSGLGPSSRHLDLMRAYPHVDAVVRGESELTLIEIVSAIALLEARRTRSREASLQALETIRGLTFRTIDGKISANQDRELIQNLDDLPFPSLDLYAQVISKASDQTKRLKYLSVEEHIHLEAGRGCPFSCTFCSNTYLWRRRYRLKSPQRLVAEIRAAKAFGATKFLLHQQLFTANKVKTQAFCEALLESHLEIEWSCFTRTDCVTPDLLSLMKSAGCNTVMYGIESGAQRIQDVIHKKARIEDMTTQIKMTMLHGIKPQLSYIVGFPDETADELKQTVDMYCRYKFEDNVESQIGLLVPAGGTEVLDSNLENLQFDGVQTTTWYTRFFDEDSFDEIARHPLVFPQNHFIPTTHVTRELLKFIKIFDIVASYLRRSCKYAILRRLTSLPFEAYELYSRWRADIPPETRHAEGWDGVLSWDTDAVDVIVDFAQFLSEAVAPRDANPAVLRGVVAYELAVALVNQQLRERGWSEVCTCAPERIAREMIEDVSIGITVDVELPIDLLLKLIDAGDVDGAAYMRRMRTCYRVFSADGSRIDVETICAERKGVRSEELFRQVEF